jgi:CubicO group peptidase (beta-lactamase class C family)
MTHTTDARFLPVADLFESYLQEAGFSGQLSVTFRGEPVVDMAGGALSGDSLTGVYSVSKGIAALVIARLIDAGDLDPSARVTRYWPEFGAHGKGTLTVQQVLSHQGGIPLVSGVRPLGDLLDSENAAAALAAQRPLWQPGTAFGYHAVTIGVVMEELVRRIRGTTLQQVFETEIRSPREADFYLGLPANLDRRYAEVEDAVLTSEQQGLASSAPPRDALAEAVFANFDVPDDRGPSGMSANNERIRRAGPSAIGGVGSARGLARLYADALPGSTDPIARPETFALMAQQQAWGHDRTLDCPNAFGIVFMLPQPRMPFAGLGAFGHDGAGGALAFADPSTEIAFGYIPVPMQYPGGADFRALALARLVRECARPIPVIDRD